MIERRKFLTGLASIIAAPAIVRVASIMPVRALSDLEWLALGDVMPWPKTGDTITLELEEYTAVNIARAFSMQRFLQSPSGRAPQWS